jgi:hypothetical protein
MLVRPTVKSLIRTLRINSVLPRTDRHAQSFFLMNSRSGENQHTRQAATVSRTFCRAKRKIFSFAFALLSQRVTLSHPKRKRTRRRLEDWTSLRKSVASVMQGAAPPVRH